MTRFGAKHRAFLAAYRITGRITQAAHAAKVDRREHYSWLEEVSGYREKFTQAQLEAADALEDEAIRRATEGVYKPLVYQGNFTYPQIEVDRIDPKTGEITGKKWIDKPGAKPIGVYEKSDGLMQFLLRGMKPEKYRQQSLEVTGPGGGPLEIVERLNAARARVTPTPE